MSDKLRDFAELVLRGLEKGSIKSKPIMEFGTGDVGLVMRSLEDICREALAPDPDAGSPSAPHTTQATQS